jgi:hypothetical protein
MDTAATRFRAMGTDVHILVVGGPPSLLNEARELVEALEARWSRFRPDSEVSRLRLLAATATDGLLVDDRGSLHPSAGFDRFTRPAPERAG